MLENWAHNRRKAVWVSVSVDLRFDAERDLRDLGASHVAVHALHKLGYQHVTEPTGVMFCTYSALVARASDRKRRLDQLVDWCGGADFEGPLIFGTWARRHKPSAASSSPITHHTKAWGRT